jgi:hypothetical protein
MTLQASSSRLQRELDTFVVHREKLLSEAPGKFALVHEAELAGVYDSQMAAITAGYERFGNVPFLVKQVVAVETPLPFTTPLISS